MDLPAYPDGVRKPEEFRRAEGEPEHTASLDDYSDLELVLDGADRNGVLDVPAEDKQNATEGNANLVREEVIAERLWLLGYLKNKKAVASSEDTVASAAFLNAVADFQAEAGLDSDQWSGDETWTALQQLVTFVDAKTDVPKYCPDGVPMPALVRAARLRLWALGFLGRKPKPGPKSKELPENALLRFWTIWCRFNPGNLGKPPPSSEELVHYLFDQDHLLEQVAKTHKKKKFGSRERLVFAYYKLKKERQDRTDPEVESFLSCLAKIELWLLGYEVDITHNRNYPVFAFRDSVQHRNRKLNAALGQFWGQADDEEAAAMELLSKSERRKRRADQKRLKQFITPELFIALQDPDKWHELSATAAQSRTVVPENDVISDEVAAELESQEKIESTWKKGKSLGMKLWDGARRLWRWIKRGILRLLKIARNMVRAFFRYSMKAFEIVKRAVSTVADSIPRYLDGKILDEWPIHLEMSKDGDIESRIPEQTSPEALHSATLKLRHFGAAFRFSCQILAEFMRVLRKAIKGVIGWALLLWQLVKSYRGIRPLYKQLKALSIPEIPEESAMVAA